MNDSGGWVWCPYIASFEKLWVWWKVKSNWSLEFCDPDPDAPMSLLSHFSIHLLCSLHSLRSLLILVVSQPHHHHSAESPWSPVTSYLLNPRVDISPHLFVARLPSCPFNLLHPLWLLLASLSASLPQPILECCPLESIFSSTSVGFLVVSCLAHTRKLQVTCCELRLTDLCDCISLPCAGVVPYVQVLYGFNWVPRTCGEQHHRGSMKTPIYFIVKLQDILYGIWPLRMDKL